MIAHIYYTDEIINNYFFSQVRVSSYLKNTAAWTQIIFKKYIIRAESKSKISILVSFVTAGQTFISKSKKKM